MGSQGTERRVFLVGKHRPACFEVFQAPARIGAIELGQCLGQLLACPVKGQEDFADQEAEDQRDPNAEMPAPPYPASG